MWSAANPTEGCPNDLMDLAKHIEKRGTKDPWGNELVMFCGDNLPAEAKGGFGVLSKGRDGVQGTADDIKSWER